MKRGVIIAGTVAAVSLAVLCFVATRQVTSVDGGFSGGSLISSGPCQRIVSLAPSVTATPFALGLGDRVVGVTRFGDFPPEALKKPKVGGFSDPSYERILELKPDHVFLLEFHEVARDNLTRLRIKTETLTADSIPELIASIRAIGSACGVERNAEKLVRSMEQRLAVVRGKIAGRERPRVLVSIGRTMGSGSLKDIYAAGRGTIFGEAVELAGGANALEDDTADYPRLSIEGVLDLDPDVIVDLVVDMKEKHLDAADIVSEWRDAAHVAAVRNGRVYVLGQDYVVVPGPRIVLLVEQLARLFHPEIDWSDL